MVSLSLVNRFDAIAISWFDLEDLAKYFGFGKIRQCRVKNKNIWRVSGNFDLLILTANKKPIPHRCKRYWMIIQLPLNRAWSINPATIYRNITKSLLIRQARKAERVFVYSNFVADVLMQNWGLRCEVLYPPVRALESGKKKNIILSVGRFFRTGNNKRYDILTDVYNSLDTNWEYHIAGSCNDFEYVRELMVKNPKIFFHINESRENLIKLYSKAKIFWHGAGYGTKNPEEMEHFGISTVEAMSAGCVPLVFNGGGQKEIVRSELRWDTPSQLLEMTKNLMRNKALDTIGNVMVSDSKKFTHIEYAKDVTICDESSDTSRIFI